MIILDVTDLKIGQDGTVIVFLSDESRYEYHAPSRLWREINKEITLENNKGKKEDFSVATSTGQKIGAAGLQLAAEEVEVNAKEARMTSLVDLIARLDDTAKKTI